MYRDCRDVTVARHVAEVSGQPHQVIRTDADFLTRFPELAERTVYLTDGSADVSWSAPFYVCQKACEISPVRITGNYGDQILRRFRSFKPTMPAVDLFRPELMAHVRAAGETYNRIAEAHPLTFCAFRQAPWHHQILLSLEQTQLAQRSPFLDNDVVRMNFRAPASALENNDVRLRLIEDGNPVLRQISNGHRGGRQERGFHGSNRSPLPKLHVQGRVCLRSRHATVGGARRSRALHFSIWSVIASLGRHKYYHFRIWYRDALSKYIQEMLLDPLTLSRPYLDRKAVEAVVRSHVKGERNYTTPIHKLLSLELIHRLLLNAN